MHHSFFAPILKDRTQLELSLQLPNRLIIAVQKGLRVDQSALKISKIGPDRFLGIRQIQNFFAVAKLTLFQ